jgi:hypothetical protein
MPFGDQFHIEIRKPALSPWDSTVSDGDQWFRSVENNLRKIVTAKSGIALMNASLDSGTWIAVEPLNWNECNAHGGFLLEVQPSTGRTFTGKVKFDPALFQQGSRCFQVKLGSKYSHGGQPDEVFFHELIHAIRGSISHQKVPLNGGLWRYGDTEEFFAVVVTNIYISEKGTKGSGLRGGERGKISLESYFSDSFCFFASSSQILPRMLEFKKQHEQLFTDLSVINTSFNPIKAMLEHPRAVEKISKAAATISHEKGAEKHQRWVDKNRVAELNAAAAALRANDEKKLEHAISQLLNSPDQFVRQLSQFGSEAVDALNPF